MNHRFAIFAALGFLLTFLGLQNRRFHHPLAPRAPAGWVDGAGASQLNSLQKALLEPEVHQTSAYPLHLTPRVGVLRGAEHVLEDLAHETDRAAREGRRLDQETFERLKARIDKIESACKAMANGSSEASFAYWMSLTGRCEDLYSSYREVSHQHESLVSDIESDKFWITNNRDKIEHFKSARRYMTHDWNLPLDVFEAERLARGVQLQEQRRLVNQVLIELSLCRIRHPNACHDLEQKLGALQADLHELDDAYEDLGRIKRYKDTQSTLEDLIKSFSLDDAGLEKFEHKLLQDQESLKKADAELSLLSQQYDWGNHSGAIQCPEPLWLREPEPECDVWPKDYSKFDELSNDPEVSRQMLLDSIETMMTEFEKTQKDGDE